VRSLVAGNTKKHGAAWALAIEICCGARKIEILDPNIQFTTLSDYHAQKDFEIVKIGDPNADFLEFKKSLASDDLLSHTIVQIGVAETIGKQTWLSIILGHAGGILTQLSYDVIEWDDSIEPNDLKMPNDELVRELQHEMLFYRKEIVKMSEQVSSLFETQKKYEREIANLRQAVGENSSGDESNDSTPRTAFATFKKKDGSFVTIKKAPNMKKWTEDDKQTVLNELAEELQKKNGLAVNTSTMRQLGLGAETVAKFKQRENKPRAAVPQQEQKQTAGDVSVAPPAHNRNKGHKHHKNKKKKHKKRATNKNRRETKNNTRLLEGEKIVSGDPMQRTLQTKSNISEM